MSVLVEYREADGCRTALLVSAGHKYLKVVTMDQPMRVRQVPLSEGRHMKVMPYPIKQAKALYRNIAVMDWKWWMNVPANLRGALEE